MQPQRVLVRSPARLHFGLFSFGNIGRQFGGVGVMVQQPSVAVELRHADKFTATGPHTDLVEEVATRWAQTGCDSHLPQCSISVLTAPRRHVGLGSGTQLALSVAAALNAWHQKPTPTAHELVQLTGRGRRSAVGTYGFLHGGLIVESGKLPDDELSPMNQRLDVPGDWQFVLIRIGEAAGLHGPSEHKAFENLPPVDPRTRAELEGEVDGKLIPALLNRDFDAFADSVFRFGNQAGSCFAPVQGGPYNGPRVTQLVDEVRALGYPGVGQSSWGPTLFCVVPTLNHAKNLVDTLEQRHGPGLLELSIAAPDNHGAKIVVD